MIKLAKRHVRITVPFKAEHAGAHKEKKYKVYIAHASCYTYIQGGEEDDDEGRMKMIDEDEYDYEKCTNDEG